MNEEPLTLDWLRRSLDRQLLSRLPHTPFVEILTRTGAHASHAYENDFAGTGSVRCSCGLFAPGRVNVTPLDLGGAVVGLRENSDGSVSIEPFNG